MRSCKGWYEVALGCEEFEMMHVVSPDNRLGLSDMGDEVIVASDGPLISLACLCIYRGRMQESLHSLNI